MPPPLVVCRMVPLSPTVQTVLSSIASTLFKGTPTPETCAGQVVPLSVVPRIVPPLPTAHAVEEEAASMSHSGTPVAARCNTNDHSPCVIAAAELPLRLCIRN